MSPRRRRPRDAPVLRAAAPGGPGWVHATLARRTYRRRLGFAQGDLVLSAEGSILVLHRGGRFVGFGAPLPLVEVIEEGWIPRPTGFTGRAVPGEGKRPARRKLRRVAGGVCRRRRLRSGSRRPAASTEGRLLDARRTRAVIAGGASRLAGNVLYPEGHRLPNLVMIAGTESVAHADAAADAVADRTFRVRVENLPALRERIERIDRRARRLGTGPVLPVDTGRRHNGRAVVVLQGDAPRELRPLRGRPRPQGDVPSAP